MVLHTTTGDGTIPVDIFLQRKMGLPSTSKGTTIDLYVSRFLGAGKFGRALKCDAFLENKAFCGTMVVKLAHQRAESELDSEAAAYEALHPVYKIAVPLCLGLYTGAFNGFQYTAILLEDCGEPIETMDSLSFPDRYKPFASFHPQG